MHKLIYSEDNPEAELYHEEATSIIKKANLNEEYVRKESEIGTKKKFCKRIENIIKGKKKLSNRQDLLFYKLMRFLNESKNYKQILHHFNNENEARIKEILDCIKFCKYLFINDNMFCLTSEGKKMLVLLEQK
ncbi:MAG: hypothetical protein KAT28_03500 [Candidatus Aenigmarchaeota archaeon]|nr:hypothetical protein [Candidatus Aenigmarchaeota archaeon]